MIAVIKDESIAVVDFVQVRSLCLPLAGPFVSPVL